MHVIDNQQDFNQSCDKLLQEKIIYMDTEFHRKRTYYAKLSTVQIATSCDRMIIDVRSSIGISALKEILASKDIVKVFHSASQDLEIFLHLFKEMPKNIFDTQIAAGVVGFDGVMGYDRLCKQILHVNIDKSYQKANWLVRPLKKELLEYAIKDVEYLIPLHRELSRTIAERKLGDAFNDRMEKLLDVTNYFASPKKIIKKMKLKNKSENFHNILLHFVELREECAKFLDIPRNYAASDCELIELCEVLPKSEKELSRLKISWQPIAKNKFKEKLLNLCAAL